MRAGARRGAGARATPGAVAPWACAARGSCCRTGSCWRPTCPAGVSCAWRSRWPRSSVRCRSRSAPTRRRQASPSTPGGRWRGRPGRVPVAGHGPRGGDPGRRPGARRRQRRGRRVRLQRARDRQAADGFAAARRRSRRPSVASGSGGRATELLGRPTSAAELFALARTDDVEAEGLVTDAMDELAVHVANLAIAVDPRTDRRRRWLPRCGGRAAAGVCADGWRRRCRSRRSWCPRTSARTRRCAVRWRWPCSPSTTDTGAYSAVVSYCGNMRAATRFGSGPMTGGWSSGCCDA